MLMKNLTSKKNGTGNTYLEEQFIILVKYIF
jgi:hypothetical protein